MSWMGTNDNCWNRYYSFLGPINMIIEGIKTADGDDERLRDYVQGEALVWRAYSYFKLLQYFLLTNKTVWHPRVFKTVRSR
ncbi:MAG: RagB/SusD family nutrient uptake outer membrane protein [Butyricimonas faecalis]